MMGVRLIGPRVVCGVVYWLFTVSEIKVQLNYTLPTWF